MEHNTDHNVNIRGQRAFEKEEAYLRAQKKVKALIGFYWHFASYVIVNIFIIVLIVTNGGELWSFGTFATAIFWGIGVFFHFMGVYGPDFLFGKNWEERKIKELMDKDKKRWE
ncbi:2TM domain-containing protein [Psychroserpens algicola]|uniref:2TM domain-containing protein n=1 Tax=Psychroserpens algicola TaxID=1719034 RepID=A0ABT0H568_9FLAO|nr:2TM domain-containing protein [Psychroserpens algicola]MCK8479523.1 2TM domain-containing protein [Psychroserpens algicola]